MTLSHNSPHAYMAIRLAETSSDNSQSPEVRAYAIAQLKQYLEDVAASLPAPADAP